MVWFNIDMDVAEIFAETSQLDRYDPNVAFAKQPNRYIRFVKPRPRVEREPKAAPKSALPREKKPQKRYVKVKAKKPPRIECIGCKGPMPADARASQRFCEPACCTRYRTAEYEAACDRSPLRSAVSIAMSRRASPVVRTGTGSGSPR